MLNESRRIQLTNLMGERNWDCVLLYGNGWRKESFRSLVNFNFQGPHALTVVHRSGETAVVVTDSWDAEAVRAGFSGDVFFFGNLAAGLAKLIPAGTQSCAVAGVEFLEKRFVEEIRRRAGTIVPATAEVEELRRVKTKDEIERLAQASILADRGYAHFAEVIRVGMAEYELVAEVESFLKANGAEDNFMLIASGGQEVTGMKPPTERTFQRGDSVTTELTPQVDGYYAQICRTLVLGEPSAGQMQSFAIFSEAQKAAEELLKPGVKASDVARVQNDVFRKHGFGEYTGSRYTRVRGHCLGLYPDETPHILEDVDYVLKKDMVVIAHPNTYLPLSGYMVLGDPLLVTENGCERLNRTEKKLFQKG